MAAHKSEDSSPLTSGEGHRAPSTQGSPKAAVVGGSHASGESYHLTAQDMPESSKAQGHLGNKKSPVAQGSRLPPTKQPDHKNNRPRSQDRKVQVEGDCGGLAVELEANFPKQYKTDTQPALQQLGMGKDRPQTTKSAALFTERTSWWGDVMSGVSG